MGTKTPWGLSDSATKLSVGIILYTTPSHGGIHLSPKKNAIVHYVWRDPKGWYEEDCAWSIVALTFPELFSERQVETARATAKEYYPHTYMAVTGEQVLESESQTLRQEVARVRYASDWVVTAAWGDHSDRVPVGMVGVCSMLGGRRTYLDKRPPVEERYFLVTEAEYAEPRSAIGHVVNLQTAQPWGGPYGREVEVESFNLPQSP